MTRSKRPLCTHTTTAIAIAFAIVCSVRLATANPFAPPVSVPDAQSHYLRGKALFNDKRFDAAAAEFATAYQLDSSAKFLLFNLALARRMQAACPEAIAAYELFIAAGPPEALVKNAQTGIADCRDVLAHTRPWLVPTNPRAAALLEHGRGLVGKGDYPAACDAFEQSCALELVPGNELDLADCDEHVGHLAEAWRRFDDAATRLDTAHDDLEAKSARDRRDALTPRTGELVVDIAKPGGSVSIAGRSVESASEIRARVDPGATEVRVGTEIRAVQVAAGASVVVSFPSAPALSISQPGAGTQPGPRAHVWRKRAAYAAGIAGVVTGGLSVGLAIDARDRYDSVVHSSACNLATTMLACTGSGESALQHAVGTANLGTGFAVASALLFTGGVVLYFTSRHTDAVVAPTATASSAGVVVAGTF